MSTNDLSDGEWKLIIIIWENYLCAITQMVTYLQEDKRQYFWKSKVYFKS